MRRLSPTLRLFYKIGLIRKMRVYVIAIFLFSFIFCEELERETRNLDSQGFKALLELGKLISNFGIDNLEQNVTGFINHVSKNLIVFYFLLFATFLAHFVTFFCIIITVRSRPTKTYNLRTTSTTSDFEEFTLNTRNLNFNTNDREYWPAPPTPPNSPCETYI